ncbi:MAG: UDP-N-acetylmuramoyl-L-alanyl-D-glutamate--2,6-diaminopimelate ligase [Sutterella sp.]|nr:UDP-N-acetylmuramoyl-L-alanyl-D-glutamate--2,6-diaminopimelate ligase [Sutterella sp.]
MEKSIQEIAAWLTSIVHEGAHLRLDSRTVKPGDVFVAVPGARSDGRRFIRVAAARGAAGVLLEAQPLGSAPECYPVASLAVERLSERLGKIATAFYGNPTASMTGVAVTGTNGKTTTTHWIADMMSRAGRPCAVLGTVGCKFAGRHFDMPALTTPDAVSLQGVCADVKKAGAAAFALEASSIGLEQGRLTGTVFDTAVFTNLTRDHLDYHGTMEAYCEAKAALFAWPGLRTAVINADDPAAFLMVEAARKNGADVWMTTLCGNVPAGAGHYVEALDVRASEAGTRFTLVSDGEEAAVHMPQVGRFNVSNFIQAAAVLLAKGASLEDVAGWAETLAAPPGRMQLFRAQGAPLAVVDYSHTPDALEKALESLRPVAEARGGRLWAVFGCGGDRDAGKRPVMGRIAAALADEVVVTSDNPRTEDPEAILRDILAGADGLQAVADRREAICGAVARADARDVVLVAGKGHEDYQEINGVKHHFSDAEVVRVAFNDRRMQWLMSREAE